MSIFVESLALIKSVESHLVADKEGNIPLVGYLKRLVWLPTKFLRMGIRENFKGPFIWVLLAFVLLMCATWSIKSISIAGTETANIIMLASMVAPMFLVIFALPSTYGHSGVALRDVEFVVERLHVRGFKDASDVELMRRCIESIEERARRRIKSLKWVVALAWAGFVYAYSKGIENSMPSVWSYSAYIYMSAVLFLSVSIAYLAVWGYEAAFDRLFRAIYFGCADFCRLKL